MPDDQPADRRPGQAAVEAALRHVAAVDASTTADAMLRSFLTLKRVWQIHRDEEDFRPSGADLDDAAAELIQLLPGASTFAGSIALRGTKSGHLRWMRNDTARGSIVTYAARGKKGNPLYEEDEEGWGDWHLPLKSDAAQLVAGAQLGRDKPARDALAAIFLRDDNFDPSVSWAFLVEETRARLGLTEQELQLVTGEPVLSDVGPFDGDEWDLSNLSPNLAAEADEPDDEANGGEDETGLTGDIPPLVAAHVARVVSALKRYGGGAFVALVGVPGTSKSHVARLAAREFASSTDCLRELQFSPGYTYEQFVQGMRFEEDGTAAPFPGVFLEINARALEHPDGQYVLLIDEFSRADLPRVLGELLTYVEYRGPDDRFTPMYDRHHPIRVAPNLAFLVTYNPADRSAVNLDDATLRRVRRLAFPPDMELLREMLGGNGLPAPAIKVLQDMFDACRAQAGGERFEDTMPFGHAIFHAVHTEEDLHDLWHQAIKGMLLRPRTPEHELYQTIRDHYPWHAGPAVTVVPEVAEMERAGGTTAGAKAATES